MDKKIRDKKKILGYFCFRFFFFFFSERKSFPKSSSPFWSPPSAEVTSVVNLLFLIPMPVIIFYLVVGIHEQYIV